MKSKKQLWDTTAVGLYIAICVILGLLGGNWVDKKLHTEPVFLIIGLVAGLTAAGMEVWRIVKKTTRE
jgi:ATP synthase protein I